MRAPLGEVFYNVDVTVKSAELWRNVGTWLRDARLNKKWTWTDVQTHEGPSYKTVQSIEDGDAGTVESLDKCAQALGVELVDVIYAVLEKRGTPLSPEAAKVVRVFIETTVEGRHALVALANALPLAAATTPIPPIPDGAVTPPATRPPRPARPAARPRTAR